VNGGRQRKNGIYIYAFHLYKKLLCKFCSGRGMFSEDAHYEFLKDITERSFLKEEMVPFGE
jgi:hypothetical protein